MNSKNSISMTRRVSFAFMVFMVNLYNYSDILILKAMTNISVLFFVAVVLVPMKKISKVSIAFLFYYCFLAFCLISIPFSSAVDDSLNKVKTLMLLQFELLAIYHFIIRDDAIDFAFNIIAICTIITAIFIIVQSPIVLKTARRVSYVTGDSNQSSAYLAYGAAVLFYYLHEKKKNRWVCIIGIFSSILAIALQASRTGTVVVGFILLLELVLFLSYENANFARWFRAIGIFLILSILAFYAVMSFQTLYKTLGRRLVSFYEIQMTGQSSINEMSTFDRIHAYRLAFNRFLKSPVFGNGIASFAVFAEPYLGRRGFCPNNYLELLQGIGFIGTLFYYLVYFYILRISFIAFRQRKSDKATLAITIIIAMLLEHLSVVFYYHKLEYLFLGVLIAFCSQQRLGLGREPLVGEESVRYTNVSITDDIGERIQETGPMLAGHLDRQAEPVGHTGRIIRPKHMGKRI